MAAKLSVHSAIIPVQTVSGNQEQTLGIQEAASQTWPQGAILELSSGTTVAWDGTTLTGVILGISAIGGYNYATAGAGASPLFGSVGFPGGTPTFGSVPNQTSAVNLLHGSPFATGLSIVYIAQQDTIFEAQVDASSGATYAATTALIGTQIGFTKDAGGTWYADLAKATPGTNTVATIISLNPQDLVAGSTTTQVNNGRIRFIFLQAATYPL